MAVIEDRTHATGHAGECSGLRQRVDDRPVRIQPLLVLHLGEVQGSGFQFLELGLASPVAQGPFVHET